MAAPTTAAALPCDDFMAFQEVLRKLRRVDDNIIHALNTTLPTESFGNQRSAPVMCKELHGQLQQVYSQRDAAIKACLQQSKQKLGQLQQQQRAAQGEHPEIVRRIRKEQTTLKLLQSELNVEEVVRERSLKVFHERCRLYYIPPEV